jgi:hypothetical protein
MVNASRLSNAVRAAGLMRRAFLEAREVCRHRRAFGRRLMAFPLQRRQLLKILLPAEQALSSALYTATVLEAAHAGGAAAGRLLRLLTPLLKFRACRDARKATSDAMEVRGGCGYIEDFVEARLLRDSHLGSIWEGTSNIVAEDAISRAVGRRGADEVLDQALRAKLAECEALPRALMSRLEHCLGRALALARKVAAEDDTSLMRQAASALYHVTSAVLLAAEGARLGAERGDWRRALLAGLALEHRLLPRDPLDGATSGVEAAGEALIEDEPVDEAALRRILG